MFNSGVLDVAIGLSFLYLALSLICTVVNEWIAQVANLRSKTLKKGIRQLLDRGLGQPGLERLVYDHPLVKALAPAGRDPSYIPSRTFALALLDSLPKTEKGELDDERAGAAFVALERQAAKAGGTLQQQLATWFDDTMDRVSGEYKREMATITLLVAALVVLAVNADTFDMVNRLWTNPTLREAIVEQAKVRAQQPPPLNVEYEDAESPVPSEPTITPTDTSDAALGLSEEELAAVGKLLGWSGDWQAYKQRFAQEPTWWDWFCWWIVNVLLHVPGWLVTVLAVSLGAPFWFDTLNYFINLRSAGKAPPKSGGGGGGSSSGSGSGGGASSSGQAGSQGSGQ